MKTLVFILSLLLSFSLTAQDKVFLENRTYEGKIISNSADSLVVQVYIKNNKVELPVAKKDLVNYSFGAIEDITEKLDSAATYSVTLKDRNQVRGVIKDVFRDSIRLNTAYLGVVVIQAVDIKTIDTDRTVTSSTGQLWFANPNATRYLFGPSGYNLEKGEGYYQNVYVVLNMVNVGVTDYFSIGGGFEFISTFTGTPFVFITPKVGFEVAEKVNLGAGVLLAGIPDEGAGGIAYGLGTYGSREHNITAGIGYGFMSGESLNRPIITVSAMSRWGRRVSFVSENWIVPDGDAYYPIITYGIRLFGPKMSFDLAFINSSDISDEIFIGIPYVDFVIKF